MGQTQKRPHKHAVAPLVEDTIPLFVETQVFFNVAGVVLWQFNDHGEIEAGARINLKGRFFPTVEAGIGLCDETHDETDIHVKAKAPFIRVGCDYNFIKSPLSPNRLYGGLRFGYTSFNYDLSAPTVDDPYYSGSQLEFNFKDLKSNATWMEFVFGLETRIWKHFSLGWTARYKRRINHRKTSLGSAYYIPGYGENDGSLFSGTFNVVFNF